MNKITIYLIGAVAAVALFVGGLLLGGVLRDEASTAEASVDTVEIAAATPATPDTDPDGPGQAQLPDASPWHLPAHLVETNPAGGFRFVGQRSDPSAESHGDAPGTDGSTSTDAEPGEIYRPPTMPGGLDEEGVGEPDPEAPIIVGEWVDEFTAEDIFGEPAVSETSDDSPAEEPILGEPPFRDPCALITEEGGTTEEIDGACPEGVGGTIVLLGGGDGSPPDPLAIMRQFYTSIGVPLELRCPDLGTSADGIYRPLFASNNPADFTIRYWLSRQPDSVQEVTYRSSDTEMDLWIERRLGDGHVLADPHNGVHNCPELPLPDDMPSEAHFTIEIDGVDDFGSTASVRLYATIESAEAQLGRPPMQVNFRRDTDRTGFVTVPYDPTEEMAYLASIPKTGARASTQTCTDIEPLLLGGLYSSDTSLGRFGTAVMARAPGDPVYDTRYSRAALAELTADEGVTYLLCGWAATPAARSFDLPRVTYRDSLTVRGPRHLRVRISVGGGHADIDLGARSVKVRPANWPGYFGAGQFPSEAAAAGRAFMLDEPVTMVDSNAHEVPAVTVIEVEGPSGRTQLIEVPTRTRCLDFFALFSCPEPGIAQYDVPIPGYGPGRPHCSGGLFGSCETPEETFAGNLRILVERYAGPGGAPTGSGDRWTINRQGAFAGAGRERPDTPQIDTNASYLREYRANPTARPGLIARLDFDRPVRVEVQPLNNFEEPCVEPEAYTVDELRSSHTFRWDELCYGGTYSLSMLAVDADGNERDERMVVDGERVPYPGWGYAVLSKVPIAEFTVEITIDRLADGIYPGSLSMSVGSVSIGTVVAPGSGPRCRPPLLPTQNYTRTVRSDGGRPIGWGDSVGLSFEVTGTGDGIACGVEERNIRLRINEQLWLADLLAAPEHTFTYNEADAEITVTLRDIRPR